MPCRGHAATLGTQLDALAAQETTAGWEVVVVDSGQDDATAAAVEARREGLGRLAMVRTPAGNSAAARNAGVRHARGRYLLFCDADDMVAAGWIESMTASLRRHPFVAGTLEWSALNDEWLLATRALPQRDALQQWEGFLPFAGGGNLGITRELYEAVGGFDESLDALEDTDLCFRVQLAGHALQLVAGATVHVRLRDSLTGTYRQGRAYGEATVMLQRRFRPHGMPQPSWRRSIAGWLVAIPRLLLVRDRGALARWVHRLGWRVGRIRGHLRGRFVREPT